MLDACNQINYAPRGEDLSGLITFHHVVNNFRSNLFLSTAIFIIVFLYFINLPLFLSSYGFAGGFVHHFTLMAVSFFTVFLLLAKDMRIYLHYFIYFSISLLSIVVVANIFYVHIFSFEHLLAVDIYRLIIPIFLFIYIYNFDRQAIVSRSAMLIASIVSVILNIYTFFNPFSFIPEEFVIIGRASGLFLNPNQVGMMLSLVLILCIDFIPERYRSLYVIFILTGVASTFSRSSIIGCLLAIIIIIYFRKINIMSFIKSIFIYLVIAITLLSLVIDISYIIDIVSSNSNILQRISWFESGGVTDSSTRERMRVAFQALDVLEIHPFSGLGISGMQNWTLKTHNMYLYYAVQYGIFGSLIYPLFAISVVSLGASYNKFIFTSFFILLLFYGLFSHNIMEEYYVLIACAAVAAMGAQSRKASEC